MSSVELSDLKRVSQHFQLSTHVPLWVLITLTLLLPDPCKFQATALHARSNNKGRRTDARDVLRRSKPRELRGGGESRRLSIADRSGHAEPQSSGGWSPLRRTRAASPVTLN
ncbi:hypothetical protein MHYP_G00000680 [Metynnis hypsauchen]